MKFSVISLINYLAAFVVFSDVFSNGAVFSDFSLRGSYFILPIVSILCIYFSGKFYYNKTFIIIFGLIIFFSIYNISVGKTNMGFLSKSVIGILLSSLVFYTVFRLNNGDVKKLFVVYLNFAFIIGLIGLMQEMNNIFHVLPRFGKTLPLAELPLYRVTSIFSEPQHFCEAMTPAFFVSLVSILQKSPMFGKWKSFVIIISFLLSFSAVGYIGVFFSIFLIIVNYGKVKQILIGALLVPLLMFFVYSNVVEIKKRVDGTISVIGGSSELLETNLSTFSLLTNWQIARQSFHDNPFFGGGLGSHTISYYKYINAIIGDDINEVGQRGYMVLNVEDAGSLFNRLLSETGLFGLFAFILFLYKGYLLRVNDRSNYLWIINNAVLVFFFIKLLRGGHYFLFGTFLFFWAYYFSKLQSVILKRGYCSGLKKIY